MAQFLIYAVFLIAFHTTSDIEKIMSDVEKNMSDVEKTTSDIFFCLCNILNTG